MTFDAGAQVGSASFGIGLDLQQLAKDFDAAEALAAARAKAIQQLLGNLQLHVNVPQGGGGAAPATVQQTINVLQQLKVTPPPAPPAPQLPEITVTQPVNVQQTVKNVAPPTFSLSEEQKKALLAASQAAAPTRDARGRFVKPDQAPQPTAEPFANWAAAHGKVVGSAQQSPGLDVKALEALAHGGDAPDPYEEAFGPGATAKVTAKASSDGAAARAAFIKGWAGGERPSAGPGDISGRGLGMSAGMGGRGVPSPGDVGPFAMPARDVTAFRRALGLTPTGDVDPRARLGPAPLGAAELSRALARDLTGTRAATGPFPASAADVARYRRDRGMTPTGDIDDRARLGPRPLGAAALSRASERDLRERRAEMGPFPAGSSDVRRYRRDLGLTATGDPDDGSGGRRGGMSTNDMIRFGAALAGIPLGINIAAGAARTLHDTLAGVIQQTVTLSEAGRAIGVAFGDSAKTFTAGAAGFVADPGTVGTEQQYLAAAASLGPLANQYGLTNDQVQKLVTSSGQLARIHGIELPQATQVLNEVLRGNLQQGAALDMQLLDENGTLKGTGLSFDELTAAVGRARAEQMLFANAQGDIDRQIAQSRAHSDELTVALDRLRKAWEDFQTKVAQGAKGPATAAANAATYGLEHPGVITGQSQDVQGAAEALFLSPEERQKLANRRLDEQVRGVGPVADAGAYGTNVDAFAARAAAGQRQGNTVVPRDELGRGANNLLNWVINGLVSGLGSNRDLREFVAGQGPVNLGNQLGNVQLPAPGPGAAPPVPTQPTPTSSLYAQDPIDLANQDRDKRRGDAILAQSQARIQSQLAQTRLDEIDYRSSQRRLGAAQEMADLQRTTLQLQDQMAPDLLREAELRDQMTLASRDNLDLVKQRIAAEQGALPATSELAELNYQETVATQRAVVAATDRAAGRAPRYDINQSVRSIMDIELNRLPAAQLAATEGQHGVDVANRALAAYSLTQQGRQANIQGGLYDVQSRLMAPQAALRESQAEYEAAQRSLQSRDLADTPGRTSAQAAVDAARLHMSQAASQIAQIQADAGGIPPVSVSLTIPANTTVDQGLLDRIQQAASAGTLDAILQARGAVATRAQAQVAGAGGTP